MADTLQGLLGGPDGGGLAENYLFNLGTGLLAQSGPSLQPRSVGQSIGAASQYASQAQSQAQENKMRRAQLGLLAEEQAGRKALQDWIAANPGASDADLMGAAMQFMPEMAIKSRLGSALSPSDQINLLTARMQLEAAMANSKAEMAATTTPAGVVARSVESLADTFDRAEVSDNPFAPGQMFSSSGLLGQAGLTPENVSSLPNIALSQFGDPAKIRAQAADAISIDKDTAALSQSLQGLAAQAGTGGRSATAIQQMQTALGGGNVPISVRRKVIAGALDTVIEDLEQKDIPIDQDWYGLQKRLRKQNQEYEARASQTLGFQNGRLVPQPPTVRTPLAPRKPRTTNTYTDPNTGAQTPRFRSLAEFERNEKAGKLKGAGRVVVNINGVDTWVELR